MTLASSSRVNSAATNAAYHLRAAEVVREIAEQVEAYEQAQAEGRYAAKPNHEVVGTCGHRLDVIGAWETRRLTTETAKIAEGKPRRRRCIYCPKES
jgi:hypothetical protein